MHDYRVSKSMSLGEKAVMVFLIAVIGVGLYAINKLQEEPLNYHCKKSRLYVSVNPGATIFMRTDDFCLDTRDEPLITEIK